MDRLSTTDAAFLDAEDQDGHVSMAIASIAVFEGPVPSYEEFCGLVTSRLPLIPRYQQKLRTVPLRLGPPVWVDDPAFDISHHVRRTALPMPGGHVELSGLMGRVMAQRLDRDRPLWEYWLVEGLEDDHWAVISKVHHSMVDGVSGTDLYHVFFDSSPEMPTTQVAPRALAPEPSAVELVARAAREALLQPATNGRAVVRAVAHPGPVIRQTSAFLHGLRRLAGAVAPATTSTLSGPIGQQRRFTWARATFADVRTIKAAFGGTVNDVVLAAITNGFRSLLLARGESPDSHMLPSLVPVSLRSPGQEGIYENRVSALVARLPVHLADPLERLQAIRSELTGLKEDHEAVVGETLTSFSGHLPFSVASLSRFAFRLPQHEIVTVTTNVPGPRQPLYALGRRLLEIIPYVPLATTVRTGVAILTYCDTVNFGLTGDYDSAPDLELLAHGIEAGMAELVKAAERDGREATSGGKGNRP